MISTHHPTLCPEQIQHVYPRYSKKLLEVMYEDYLMEASKYLERTGRLDYHLLSSFEHEPLSPEDLDRIRGRKIVAMSLFFKPSNFARRKVQPQTDHEGQILESELNRVQHPIWENSHRHERTFFQNYLNPVLESDFRDWVPVLYLSSNLRHLEPKLREAGFVVIRMKHESIAECPGALWRYLSFNLPCEYTYLQDTDRPFQAQRAERLIKLFELRPNAAISRPLQFTSKNGEMALILGNDFAVRPAAVDFDCSRSILGYITLNILHEDRLTNFCHEPVAGRDDAKVEPLSKRSQRGHFGPLPHERVGHKCYPYYPFDEQWLKEVVYYHFSNGRMITLMQGVRPDDVTQGFDIAHQRKHGNLLVPVVNGKPHQTSPEAITRTLGQRSRRQSLSRLGTN